LIWKQNAQKNIKLPTIPALCCLHFPRSSDESNSPFLLFLPQDGDILLQKKPRLDLIIKSTAPVALTNGIIDLCSVSDDEKEAKEDSSSIHAIIDTIIISSLLGKKCTPITTATTEPEKASPDAAVALPPDVGVDVHVHDNDANTDSVTDTRINTQSNPSDTGVAGRWTAEEDAELTSARRSSERTTRQIGTKLPR
jgi:hypothetical protein